MNYRIIASGTMSPGSRILRAYMGPPILEKVFLELRYLKVIFLFILYPLISKDSKCNGIRRGSVPNITSCHLIVK